MNWGTEEKLVNDSRRMNYPATSFSSVPQFIYPPLQSESGLILSGLCVRVCDFGEAVAVIVLAVPDGPQIIRSDPDAAVVTPNGLGICGTCGSDFRGFHLSDSVPGGRLISMRDIVRRSPARSGPIKFDSSKCVCSR